MGPMNPFAGQELETENRPGDMGVGRGRGDKLSE